MNRKIALKSIVGSVLAVPSLAKSTSPAFDPDAFRSEFVAAWKRSLDYTLAVFNQMPETKLDFKYTPEAFSFRTQFVHCINFTSGQLAGHLEASDPYEKPISWGKLSKGELAAEIKKFYEWVEALVKQVPASKLLETTNFAGDDIPKWRLFYALENHIIHHRGQAICYVRLCGVVPESYVGW